MLSTTKECFEFIAKNWTKEMYKKEKERYNKICSHILSNETETFSPLNDFCNSEFEKDNAKFCLKYHHNNWDCIYKSCISLSRAVPHYISIVLPPIYYNNKTTKQCFLLS